MSNKAGREGILFCLCGPSGVGKSVVAEALLKKNQDTLTRSISVTTRAPRAGEVDGQDYFFISEADFQNKIKAGYFFEHEAVHTHFYGTPKHNLDNSIKSGVDLILVIDIRGALNLKRSFPHNCVVVFMAAPSLSELENRMHARGTISKAEVAKRLETAKAEYALVAKQQGQTSLIDYFLVNSELRATTEAVEAILDSERAKFSRLQPQSIKHTLS